MTRRHEASKPMPMARFKLPSALLCVLLLTTGCNGGSGGSDDSGSPGTSPPPPPPPSAPAFGLTSRVPLAPISLPLEASGTGTLSLENAFPSLNFPGALFLAAVPGEQRLVVVRQSGQIEAFAAERTATTVRSVLDLSQRVLFAGEQGLLGLAFDPNFVSNRYVYLHYSLAEPARSRIARFTWNPDTDRIEPGSEKIILEQLQPFSNHNGGMLAFGPDDKLYIGFGDGGSGGDPQNHAQNTSNWLGAMLRIDVHPANPEQSYAIPLDNPFVDDASVRDEIWAYGLRNPFRFSFDRETGTLWAGDVGQSAREEINIVNAGDNLGWRVYEGSLPFNNSGNTLPDSAFTFPVFEYGRAEGISVIGGYVYRGSTLPALLGRYIYTDFGSGTVWALDYDGESVVSNEAIAVASSPTSLGEDHAGELYVVSRQGGIFGFTGQGQGVIPERLSQTGLFGSLTDLTPAAGLIEYDVNHPFWSDGAGKRRWIGLPGTARIDFSAQGNWQFPDGTVTVKHFDIALIDGDPDSTRRLETRVMIRTPAGWRGFTYRWDEDGEDARLLSGRESERLSRVDPDGTSFDQTYTYPSRSDCFRCHTDVAGTVLGIATAQINGPFAYPTISDNQLRSWNNIALFGTDIGNAAQYDAFPAPDDGSADLSARARAYLDVNCAQCHQPGGTTPVALDLRAQTALAETQTVNEVPVGGSLGIAGARIIVPGDRTRSLLWQRMNRRDAQAMPPLATHVIDAQGLELIGMWIDGL